MLIGTSSSRSVAGSTARLLQVESTSATSGIALTRNSADTNNAKLSFSKSRSTSNGGVTIVQDDDSLGEINFAGADGVDLISKAASITAFVDCTPGSNDMPGRLVFSTTADGAATPTERLRIDSSGTVGIGTTSARCKAEVYDAGVSAAFSATDLSTWRVLQIRNNIENTTGTAAGIAFGGDGSSDTETAGICGISTNSSGGVVDLAFLTATGNASTERMRITSAGNVGIGTTSPSAKLQVQGSVQFGDGGGFDMNINGTRHQFSIGGSEKMRLDSSGNLGIGTTSPSTKLQVNGTVTATTFAGNIDAVDGDFDGTLEADAITVGGVALNTVIAGVTVTNATNATNAANITAADESSDTTCFPVFVTAATGNLAPKTGSNLSFNSSSGRLTATSFAGDGSNLTGVGGDVVDDTSPQLGGNLDVNAKNIVFGDSASSSDDRLTFGAGTDLSIYHDASHSRIVDSGTGNLLIQSSQVKLMNAAASENMISATQDGAVEAYHNGTKKLSTESFGVDIEGTLRADTLKLAADNHKLEIGGATNGDLVLYHDGSESYIINSNSGSDLILQSANGVDLKHGSETMIRCNGDAEVELYHNNNLRFETTGNGVDIAGDQDISMDSSGNGQLRLLGNGYSGGIALNTTGMHIYHNAASRALIFGVNESEVARFDTNGHFIPSANNTRDLGTSSTRWRNIYTNDLNLSNEGGANDVDGTCGRYTIQEGAEDLFLINKRSGKKYKFNLTEVA